jgi:hypothetical protein
MALPNLVEDPEQVDSEDLTEEDIAQAIPVEDLEALTQEFLRLAHTHMGSSFSRHARKRKGKYIYLQSTMRVDRSPDMTFLFRLDWLTEK